MRTLGLTSTLLVATFLIVSGAGTASADCKFCDWDTGTCQNVTGGNGFAGCMAGTDCTGGGLCGTACQTSGQDCYVGVGGGSGGGTGGCSTQSFWQWMLNCGWYGQCTDECYLGACAGRAVIPNGAYAPGLLAASRLSE